MKFKFQFKCWQKTSLKINFNLPLAFKLVVRLYLHQTQVFSQPVFEQDDLVQLSQHFQMAYQVNLLVVSRSEKNLDNLKNRYFKNNYKRPYIHQLFVFSQLVDLEFPNSMVYWVKVIHLVSVFVVAVFSHFPFE